MHPPPPATNNPGKKATGRADGAGSGRIKGAGTLEATARKSTVTVGENPSVVTGTYSSGMLTRQSTDDVREKRGKVVLHAAKAGSSVQESCPQWRGGRETFPSLM